MRVTTKGQITIPIDLRLEVGIMPGSEVEFTRDGDELRLRKVDDAAGRGRALVERMTGAGDVPMSTDQILALTRGE